MKDLIYEKKRNKLIPEAVAFADKTIGTDKSIDNFDEKWTRCFCDKMDSLWAENKNN